VSDSELIKTAMEARSHAHAPYSKFAVEAALLTKSGRVFSGCNIENISLGLTMCAERVALGAAVSDGQKEFVAIYPVADSKRPIKIVTSTISGERETAELNDLLPRSKQGLLESFQDV
jgi:cytidine deaminase